MHLPIDQQLDKAKDLSSAAIRSEGALDVAKQKEEAAIRAKYQPLIQMAKDEASKQKLIQEMEEAIRRSKSGGIASIPTAPPNTGKGQWGPAQVVR